GTKVRGRRGSAGLVQVSPFRAVQRNLSQAVRDSWDKSTQRTQTTRIGRNRGLSLGTSGQKVRAGREEPRANGNVPRVFASKRDREAHFGRIGEICPRRFGTSGPKIREGREDPEKLPTNQNVTRVTGGGAIKKFRLS
ncbi:hypothetical protein KI387_015162, partial [Taxus chinensis]